MSKLEQKHSDIGQRKFLHDSCINLFMVFFAVLICDHISKYLIIRNLYFGEEIELCPFFNLVYFKNTGVTFGLLKFIPPVVLVIAAIAIIGYFVWWTKNNRAFQFPMAAILGGACGNLIDRIFRGGVVDFLDFHLSNYHWPAFNIADSAIVLGVAFVLYKSYGDGS